MSEKPVYSVSKLNDFLSRVIDDEPILKNLSVSGEVSNLTYHSTGHIYFSLKDQTSGIRVVMFHGNRANGLKFPMKDGDQVIVTGNVTCYAATGVCEILAKSIRLDGEGDLAARFEALKKQLEEMGMFDSMYKKPIPRYVSRIGVVTSPTGAAIHDIITVAKRRNPYVEIILYPAIVQGENTAASVIEGILALDALGLDVLLVGRGGGSMEELWGFNDEALARTIFACETPVISCVGHEVDFTIADFVADLRAATPSEAAEKATFVYRDLKQSLSEDHAKLTRALTGRISQRKTQLAAIYQHLLRLSPAYKLSQRKERSIYLEDQMKKAMEDLLTKKRHKVELLAGRLEALSPLKSLSQGYGYVTAEDGRKIRSVDDVKKDDALCIYVSDGTIATRVASTSKKENLYGRKTDD